MKIGRVDLAVLHASGRSRTGGTVPGLVLSVRSYNAKVGLCLVCPVTQHAKGYVFEVALPTACLCTAWSLPIMSRVSIGKHGESVHIATVPAEVLDEVPRPSSSPCWGCEADSQRDVRSQVPGAVALIDDQLRPAQAVATLQNVTRSNRTKTVMLPSKVVSFPVSFRLHVWGILGGFAHRRR